MSHDAANGAHVSGNAPRVPFRAGDAVAYVVFCGAGYCHRALFQDRAAAELYAAKSHGICERLILPPDAFAPAPKPAPAPWMAPPD